MSNIPKIQLVGCAKNEAAYLPEWIFHHLKIGFASIKVYINNTDDNSIAVLDKIIKRYPQVSYIVADDLIKSPPESYRSKTNEHFYNTNPIQAIIYTDALVNQENDNINYLAFLDVDEFFFPLEPLDNIFNVNNEAELAQRFRWLLLSGDLNNFSSLHECNHGYIDTSFKSVVPIKNKEVKIRAEDPHRFSMETNIGPINNKAFILHRVLRSKAEYLYLLSKSTSDELSKLANGFKKNRRGWTDKGLLISRYGVNFDNSYSALLSAFCEECEITTDIELARKNILTKHQEVIDNLRIINQQNIDLTRSLGGLEIHHINLFKTAFHYLFWKLIRAISPRMILSHESIKEDLTSSIKKTRKH